MDEKGKSSCLEIEQEVKNSNGSNTVCGPSRCDRTLLYSVDIYVLTTFSNTHIYVNTCEYICIYVNDELSHPCDEVYYLDSLSTRLCCNFYAVIRLKIKDQCN